MESIKLKKSNYRKFILKGSLALEHYYENNNEYSDLYANYNEKLKKYYALPTKDEINIKNTVRVSMYFYNNFEDVDKLVDALKNSEDIFKIVI